MFVDLVQVTTSDGHRLHGALETPPPGEADKNPAPTVDAWLCLHGTGSNFYSASTLAGLTPKLLSTGAAVLRANTRGHDLMSTGPTAQGRYLQGAAFERVDESPFDIHAWIDLLRERGFRRVGLLGHSLGAVKAIFTLAADAPPQVSAFAAISPPRLSYSNFSQSSRGEEFLRTFAQAEEFVRAGRGDELMHVKIPLSYYVSAAGFVDRYGPAERYDVVKLLERLACPTLVTYGSQEVQSDPAFRSMPESIEKLSAAHANLQLAMIAGADHIYSGCHDTLFGRIVMWLNRLERAE